MTTSTAITFLSVAIIVHSIVHICLIWRTERLRTAIKVLDHNQKILIKKVEGTEDER